MTLYEELGGFDALLAVCRRWHELCLDDPVAEHPFSHAMHAQHDERLAAYLTEATGGPKLYSGGYGDETFMLQLHAGNGSGPELDELYGACLRLFDRALASCGVPLEPAARLSRHFREATTVGLHRFGDSKDDIPAGLPLPIWS